MYHVPRARVGDHRGQGDKIRYGGEESRLTTDEHGTDPVPCGNNYLSANALQIDGVSCLNIDCSW